MEPKTDVFKTIGIAVVTGGIAGYISFIATVNTLQTDVSWIKEILKTQDARLERLESLRWKE
jgi:hypothetical protein